jgi:hypothetical protein
LQLWSGIDAGRSGEPAGLGYTRDATWLPSVDRLDPELTPHDLRHTWASWHYALNRDLLALKIEGGWSSVALVELTRISSPPYKSRRSASFSAGTALTPIGRRRVQLVDKAGETAPGSLLSGGRGRRFKSSHSDQFSAIFAA